MVERLIILSGEVISDHDVINFVVPSSAAPENKLKEVFEKFNNLEDLHQFIDKEFSKFNSN